MEKEEVDFIIKKDKEIAQLIQVCYDLTDQDTKKREIRAVLKASKDLKCNNLLIINQDYFGEEEVELSTTMIMLTMNMSPRQNVHCQKQLQS